MRQKLGQHFLVNTEMPGVIAGSLEIVEGDTIIEVGPGHGEVTSAIVADIQSKDLKTTKLLAVERDPSLADGMRRRFEEYPFMEIVEADILRFLADPAAKKFFSGNYKMVGNLPYYLTGHLLRMISEGERKPELAIFMVQKEVADRMAATPPRMNRLAASVQFWSEPKILFYVSRDEFDPPPEVDSAVVILKCKNIEEDQDPAAQSAYYALVRRLFSQPRKTVLNNLAGKDHKGKAKIFAILERLLAPPDSRPQNLDVSKIAKLSKEVYRDD